MNYHFKDGNRKENVLQQLQLLDQDLMKDKKQLQKLKLEAQFYEDKGKPISTDKQSLADEIMSELINDPHKPKYNFNKPQALPPPLQYNSPPKQYQPKPIYQPPAQIERQNNLMNQREMQKMKLQNQKHEGLFPNSSDHNRVRSFGKNIVQQIAEKDRGNVNFNAFTEQGSPKKAKSPEVQRRYDPAFNPFVKDDALQKQKKQQKNRQYLKALQQQRLQQQRQKKARLKEQKQMKSQKYQTSKPTEKYETTQKPIAIKKSDPNSQPPKVVATLGNYSQFDKNLIKEKVTQLRAKYKRGKVIYQEYQRQLNNLRKQYPGDSEDLQEKDNNMNKEYELIRQVNVQSYKLQQNLDYQPKEKIEEAKNDPASFPIRHQSINYSQFMPSMVQQQSYMPVHGYPPNSVPHMVPGMYSMMPSPSYIQGAPPVEYVELLKKMFEFWSKEVKEVRTQQSAQNQVLQETLNKFLMMSTQQPNLLTQQIPLIPNQQQREFYSDAKQHRQYFQKESNIKKKVGPSNEILANTPFGQSDNSQYYDKSLSGIAIKIPLNQANYKMIAREDEKGRLSALDQFYIKKHKVKPFKKFNIVVTPGQSQLQIPSTSSYFRAKNAKEELKGRFEEDLNQLKKMQKDKNFKKVQEKLISNTQYNTHDRRILKEQSYKFVSSQSISQQVSPISKQKQKEPVFNNPYLKRHISAEDNMLTFNSKELKLNSPTGFTPISKKQILQQDEYLTQPKIKEEIGGAASLINQYQQHLAQPVKALNFIKMNNQVLSKYDKSQQSKRQYITIKDSGIKEISSRDYFVNNQISPVKAPQHHEESLQTIRSDFQSVKHSIKLKANTAKFQSVPQNRPEEVQLDNEQIMQTVESVQQSSSRFRKPPLAKRRSVGKKKESSISRSKNPYQSNLSFSGSEQVEQTVGAAYPKFDSNVYESNYEQSVDLVKPKRPMPQMVLSLRKEQVKQGYIQFNPPTIITPKGSSPRKQTEMIAEVSKISISKQVAPQNKWKSLEQARKLAKEGRNKGQQSKEQRSFEQKFSELQSFMTKKGDESQQVSRMFEMAHQEQRGRVRVTKSKEKQPQVGKKQEGKRNIMKLLQQLEDDKEQDYKQQFESYREQSEQYQ